EGRENLHDNGAELSVFARLVFPIPLVEVVVMKVSILARRRSFLIACGGAVLTAASYATALSEIPAKMARTNSESTSVGLVAAMESGEIEVKYIPRDARGGNVLVLNKTKKPLTIQLPAAFAGVPVLAQRGGRGPGGVGGVGGLQGVGGGFGGGGLGGGLG